MDLIPSFQVNHLVLEPGIYVSRYDKVGEEYLTTFDLRVTAPNKEPVMNTAEVHTIEHLGATFLRNHPTWSNQVIYFGPMGCRTGFYLILAGYRKSEDIVDLMKEMFTFIMNFEGEIPGAKPEECGNYSDQNLDAAKYWAKRYLHNTLEKIDEAHLNYNK